VVFHEKPGNFPNASGPFHPNRLSPGKYIAAYMKKKLDNPAEYDQQHFRTSKLKRIYYPGPDGFYTPLIQIPRLFHFGIHLAL
jgi:hypothetical protein